MNSAAARSLMDEIKMMDMMKNDEIKSRRAKTKTVNA